MANSEENIKNNIIPVNIEEELKKCFIDYAMSVIADRALPDVRDGLKPVHRRILYSLYLLGFTPDKPHRKCATTVGEVLGKFHPHGDAAVYDSLVRLAQDFSLRYPLVDGHGNFGSIDGDSPAAMRYTEARLSKIAMEMLREINKDTVDFKSNFDEHEMEPVVLPSRFPNLLVNGSSGIAVGMATNIPPHNLGEVIDGIIQVIDNPDITIDKLIETIKGPDFPTAGIIIGKQGIRDAYTTGKGRIVVRAVTTIEDVKGSKQRIIVSELPYQVNKAKLIERIADLVKDKRIEGISDLRDESDRNDPVRIVIELKRDANANIVLNQLFKYTQMQDTFSANMLALVNTPDGKYEPKTLNLRQMLDYYILHQKDVIRRRTAFDLEKAEAGAHILEGLRIAIDNLDEVIRIIRSSRNEATAKGRLMDSFSLSDRQAQAIVDMRLGRLTALEREKLEVQYAELLEKIKYYRDILANEYMVLNIIKQELGEIKEKFADERRTSFGMDEGEIVDEDLIEKEEIAITLTQFGYIKRLPADTYRSQKRGGKGVQGITTREEDFVKDIFITSTHDDILFFTNKGKVYSLKGYQIPEGGRQAKGMAIVNLLEIDQDETVTTVIPISIYEEGLYLTMTTKEGLVKKTNLMEYQNIRRGGLAAVSLRENDELIEVKLTDENSDIILVSHKGMSIRFNSGDVRPTGRVSQGVKGIVLDDDDYIISMGVVENDGKGYLLAVTENGYGKRTELDEYRTQNRGGKGVRTYKLTEKTGNIAGARIVKDDDDILLVNTDGTVIRLNVSEISVMSRSTQGVTLMRIDEDSKIVGLAIVEKRDDEDEENYVGNEEENYENNEDNMDMDIEIDNENSYDETNNINDMDDVDTAEDEDV